MFRQSEKDRGVWAGADRVQRGAEADGRHAVINILDVREDWCCGCTGHRRMREGVEIQHYCLGEFVTLFLCMDHMRSFCRKLMHDPLGRVVLQNNKKLAAGMVPDPLPIALVNGEEDGLRSRNGREVSRRAGRTKGEFIEVKNIHGSFDCTTTVFVRSAGDGRFDVTIGDEIATIQFVVEITRE